MSKVKLEHSSLFLFKPSGLFLVDLLNDFDALLEPLDCGCAVCLEDTHKHFLSSKQKLSKLFKIHSCLEDVL